VELFVERALACREGFNLSDADAPVIADICRKLEGNALAIELTATRVDTFTLRELSAQLDNKFQRIVGSVPPTYFMAATCFRAARLSGRGNLDLSALSIPDTRKTAGNPC
jgi:predicted ATPase